jgi:hypothetical protein
MFRCSHCSCDYKTIRTARAHHPFCPVVKNSDLDCRSFSGNACDNCFDALSRTRAIVFSEMAPLLSPVEKDCLKSEAALERATGYDKKAAKLFTTKKAWFSTEMTDCEADSAWQVMTELQTSAENCCGMAAVLVNRNRSDSGLKHKPFKPLRSVFSFIY